MVVFVILKCYSYLSFLINLYFHTSNLHFQVLIMQKEIQYQCPHSMLLPRLRACFFPIETRVWPKGDGM